MKVYSGMSGRRASTDIRDCAAKGLIADAPHYNSVNGFIAGKFPPPGTCAHCGHVDAPAPGQFDDPG